MASVSLAQVTKTYRDKRSEVVAVSDLSLDIGDGEFIVLVGPSGCGKSTTLRLIAGLEELTSGTIRIGDRVVNKVAPKDRDVAMVFQNYALYPHMTVQKNMAFGLKMRKVPRAEIQRKVLETAVLLGIDHLLDRRPAALSGGERQRVALGRAVVRKPRAFLFDEPLSNLDAQLRVRTRGELKRLHGQLGTTSIYVTHDQEEAMTLGDRIVVLKDGAVQQCDTPLAVYTAPASRFVAGFVGSPAMNFIEGKLNIENGRADFVSSDGGVHVAVPKNWTDRLADHAGRPVVLGLRPETLTLWPKSAPRAETCTQCGARLAGPFCHQCGAGAERPSQDDRAGAHGAIDATVEVVEPLGKQQDVYLRGPGGVRLTARLPASVDVAVGLAVEVRLDPTEIHLFAGDSDGRRLAGR